MLQSKGHNREGMCISEQSLICFSRLVSGTDLQVKQKVSTGKLKGGDNTVPSVSLSEACRKEFHEGQGNVSSWGPEPGPESFGTCFFFFFFGATDPFEKLGWLWMPL